VGLLRRVNGPVHAFPASSVSNVEWREAGMLFQGWLHFVVPGGKPHGGYLHNSPADGTVYFWPKEQPQFRAIHDAVLARIQETRRRD